MKKKHLKYRREETEELLVREQPQMIDDVSLVLQYMIMHDDVCKAAYEYFESGLLKLNDIDRKIRPIYKNVLEYYQEYEEAPKRGTALINRNPVLEKSQDTLLILEGVALEYEKNKRGYKINPIFIIDVVLRRFLRANSVYTLSEKIERELSRGRIDVAERLVKNYEPVEIEDQDSDFGTYSPLLIDYYEDLLIRESQMGSDVFSFGEGDGDIRYVVGPLKKQWLVSFSGSTKSGKSYILWEIARRAATEGKRVLFFNAEMTERDMTFERILPWLLDRPLEKKGYDYLPYLDCQENQFQSCPRKGMYTGPENNGPLYIPGKTIMANDFDCRMWKRCTRCNEQHQYRYHYKPAVHWKRKRLKTPINKLKDKTIKREAEASLRLNALERDHNLRVVYFPKYSATIEECLQKVKNIASVNKWIPDIVIFDYIDILKLSGGTEGEPKWQMIDHMWKMASAFAQEMNCLVITAEQTTQAGRIKRTLDHTVTPEASAKDHHLNKKFGVVKYEDETSNNICRLNKIYDRHGAFNRKDEVLITQDLTHGCAVVDSVFWRDNNQPPYPITIPSDN